MKYIYSIFFIALLIAGCTEYEDYTPYRTAVNQVSGEFIGAEDCGGSVYGPYSVFIFNTAENSEEVAWLENIYDSHYQVKVSVDGKSFSATNAQVYDSDPGADSVAILPVDDLFADVTGNVINEDSINFTFVLKEADGTEVDNCSFAAKRLTGFE